VGVAELLELLNQDLFDLGFGEVSHSSKRWEVNTFSVMTTTLRCDRLIYYRLPVKK
jgi:hypothetical protein